MVKLLEEYETTNYKFNQNGKEFLWKSLGSITVVTSASLVANFSFSAWFGLSMASIVGSYMVVDQKVEQGENKDDE